MSKPALPTLIVPPTEATAKIAAQITRGREIQESARSASGGFDLGGKFARARADQEKWAKYTIDLLKSLFGDPSISEEFGDWYYHPPAIGTPYQPFIEWVETRIRRLESIQERINLFPTSGNKAQAPVFLARAPPLSTDIFIVHGHNGAAKQEVARFIEQLGLRAIILHERPDKGRTIIEKFEDHSAVGFAVVLLTPDDVGHPKDEHSKAKPRPRQNVVLELGYFIGILGRSRVCALKKGDIEIPTDYSGVLYTPMDDAGAWKFKLATEIREAGISVDLNKL